ncbi:MAG: nucleotidyl transferase AbiEii/AbiGii toxin family protein [Chloroflexota bacterium]
MPDVNQRLRVLARERQVRLDIVEKDYALNYLLAAISEIAGFGDRIVLKGGTALKKFYYPDYRFSEDLDYSTLKPGPLTDSGAGMAQAIARMTDLLLKRGPFEVRHEALTLKLAHPGDQAAYLVRVRFPGQRQMLCRLKVEITVDEPILLPVEKRPILHGFDEEFLVSVDVYALAEIVAEKLRALLQSREHLSDRGWGASRACRDYYDLWSVLRREGRLNSQIPELVRRKCEVRGVTFEAPKDFLAEALLDVARREWNQQLLPFVPDAPPAEQVLAEVRPLIFGLWA